MFSITMQIINFPHQNQLYIIVVIRVHLLRSTAFKLNPQVELLLESYTEIAWQIGNAKSIFDIRINKNGAKGESILKG